MFYACTSHRGIEVVKKEAHWVISVLAVSTDRTQTTTVKQSWRLASNTNSSRLIIVIKDAMYFLLDKVWRVSMHSLNHEFQNPQAGNWPTEKNSQCSYRNWTWKCFTFLTIPVILPCRNNSKQQQKRIPWVNPMQHTLKLYVLLALGKGAAMCYLV